MAETREEWSAKEARRISRLAMCVPEPMRAEYIAHMMVNATPTRGTSALRLRPAARLAVQLFDDHPLQIGNHANFVTAVRAGT